MKTLTEDRKMNDLISRVGGDVSQLRSDIRSLFAHTGRHVLPDGARELREQARRRLMAGVHTSASIPANPPSAFSADC